MSVEVGYEFESQYGGLIKRRGNSALASLARAVADGLGTDRASLEDASDRFGPFRADQSDAVNKLRDKGLITGNDENALAD